jgi:hypothetical protein
MQTTMVARVEKGKIHRATKPSAPGHLNSSRKELGDRGEPEPEKPRPFWTWFIENPRSRESY